MGLFAAAPGAVLNVQLIISWTAVSPPVAPVKPTNAVLPTTMLGMFTGAEVENVLPVLASVMVQASVVPSYVMCTLNTSALWRFTPEGERSVEGLVGEAPLVYMPVESPPSPALLKRSNLMATLLGIPGARAGVAGPYPSPPPTGPKAAGLLP